MALYADIAKKLMRDNGHLGAFEVNCLDQKLAEEVALQLEKSGCTVMRDKNDTRLVVTCPDKHQKSN